MAPKARKAETGQKAPPTRKQITKNKSRLHKSMLPQFARKALRRVKLDARFKYIGFARNATQGLKAWAAVAAGFGAAGFNAMSESDAMQGLCALLNCLTSGDPSTVRAAQQICRQLPAALEQAFRRLHAEQQQGSGTQAQQELDVDGSSSEKPDESEEGAAEGDTESSDEDEGEGEPVTGTPGQPPAATGQPPAATGQPPAATGLPPADPGQPPAATGQPPAATGQPPAATGLPPAATGQPPAATGLPPADPGQPPAATGQPPAATGLPPAATGQPPAATGQPPAATGKPPAATGKPPAATGKPPADSGLPSATPDCAVDLTVWPEVAVLQQVTNTMAGQKLPRQLTQLASSRLARAAASVVKSTPPPPPMQGLLATRNAQPIISHQVYSVTENIQQTLQRINNNPESHTDAPISKTQRKMSELVGTACSAQGAKRALGAAVANLQQSNTRPPAPQKPAAGCALNGFMAALHAAAAAAPRMAGTSQLATAQALHAAAAAAPRMAGTSQLATAQAQPGAAAAAPPMAGTSQLATVQAQPGAAAAAPPMAGTSQLATVQALDAPLTAADLAIGMAMLQQFAMTGSWQ